MSRNDHWTHSEWTAEEGQPAALCASFYLADALMGVPIDQIEEINREVSFTPVPHAPRWVRGVINLRGSVSTVVDLRAALGMEPAPVTRHTRNVIVRSHGERIGLIVDRVAEVIAAERGRITAPPANVRGADRRFFRGVYPLQEQVMVILDVDAVLALDAAPA